MPTEPENKMDELLKSCAKQRREQAGSALDLHPATRQMLQAEVRRVFPPEREKASSGTFFNLRRMLLSGAGLATAVTCAVLAVKESQPLVPPPAKDHHFLKLAMDAKEASAVADASQSLQLSPRSNLETETRQRQLARQDAYLNNIGLDKTHALSLQGEPVVSSTDDEKSLAASGNASFIKGDEVSLKPLADASAALPSTSNNMAVRGTATASTPGQADDKFGTALAMPQPAAETAGAMRSVAAPSSQVVLAASNSDELNKVRAKDLVEKKVIPPILNNFKIRLEGDQIRLTDADGSTYVGKITTALKTKLAIAGTIGEQKFSNVAVQNGGEGLKSELQTAVPSGVIAAVSNSAPSQKPAPATPPQQEGSYSFHASGTNLSLKQTVVIEGVYFATGITGERQQQKTVEKTKQYAIAAKRAAQEEEAEKVQAASGVVQGRAQIGNGETVEIDAVAVSSTDDARNIK